MKSKILEDLEKKIPLKTRLYVSNQMWLITSLVDLGYIKDRMWTDSLEDEELLRRINALAKEHTKNMLENINRWEIHGRPRE